MVNIDEVIKKAMGYDSILTQDEYNELLKWVKVPGSKGREACDALATALAMDARPFRYVRRDQYTEQRYVHLGRARTSSGCFVTTACMRVLQNDFDDEGYELNTLRKLRDEYVAQVKPSEVKYYYEMAPKLVEAIDSLANKEAVYQDIYNAMILKCVKLVDNGNFVAAYKHYRDYYGLLEAKFLREGGETTQIE